VADRHARLGPSSSEIWLTCLGAPHEWSLRPPRKVGFAAHEGTLAHTLCEAASKLGKVPWKAGWKFNVGDYAVDVTQEMLDAVALFWSTTSGLSDASHWRCIEQEVSLAWLWAVEPPEDIFGTLDFASCDGSTLYVLDFKYGRGKAVKAERNTQLLLYALGIWDKLKRERPDLADTVETVCLAIVQPRAGGPPVRAWTLSLGDLFYWANAVFVPSVETIAWSRNIPLTPGSHCYFCAAAFDCEVYREARIRRSIESFPDWVDDEEERI
jgi:hypothetical protein